MICYYHADRPAVGTCKYCQRGLCRDCAQPVTQVLACRDRHEAEVGQLNMVAARNLLQVQRMSAGYTRNFIFYGLVGVVFSGLGLAQYRFLGLQGITFILIGIFLLYAAVANLAEGRKYR